MYDIIVFELKPPFSRKKDRHAFCKLKKEERKEKKRINTVKAFYKTCALGPRKLRLRVDGIRVKRRKKWFQKYSDTCGRSL